MNKLRDKLSGDKTVLKLNKTVFPCKTKPDHQFKIQHCADEIIKNLQSEVDKEQFTQESIQSSFETVSNQRTKKKRWLSVLFLVINLLILAGIFLYQFLHEESVSISDLITTKIHWEWVLIVFGLFMLENAIDALRISATIKKLTGRFRPILSYKSVLCARFYDNITPLGTGGQPFQIFYLSRRGLNASSATSVPLVKYIYSQIVFIIVSALVLCLDGGVILAGLEVSPIVVTMCYIGLGLNLLLVLVVLWLSISKKIAPRMMLGILKFLKFLHIIKNEQAVFEKVMKGTKEYISIFRMFMSSGWLVLVEVLSSCVFMLCHYSIAFCVYCIFCGFDINLWFTFFVIQLACDLAISFIPIPGGAGTAELSFAALSRPIYAAALGASVGGILVWAILFYRILTYYGVLIQGGLLILYDFAIGNKRIKPMLERYKRQEWQQSDVTRLREAVIISSNAVLEELPKKRERSKAKINKNGDTSNEE